MSGYGERRTFETHPGEGGVESEDLGLPFKSTPCEDWYGFGDTRCPNRYNETGDLEIDINSLMIWIGHYSGHGRTGWMVWATNELERKQSELKNQSKQMTDEDKEMIMIEAIDRIKKEVQQNGEIESNVIGVYMYLYSKGVLPVHTEEFKEKYTKLAIPIARGEAASKATYSLDDHKKLKERIESITQGKSEVLKNIAKKLILTDYFKNK